MDKDSVNSHQNSGAYMSPGTPDHEDNNGKVIQKRCCSEKVPWPNNNSKQRRTSVNIVMPINNGRTLPSKWDDAERWITSPVSGPGVCKNLAPPPPQRRPKAKSGPLGPYPGDIYFSGYSHSPSVPMLEGGSTNNIFAGFPPAHTDYRGVPSEMFIESPPDAHDENGNHVTFGVSRRDMATQMSPVDSPESSLTVKGMISTSPPPVEPNGSHHFARVDVRDVQVDKRVTMTQLLERRKKRTEKSKSTEINGPTLTWNPTDGAMELSKLQKEEARITAWENLQIAKAEASIRKLEMKLEKKKSKSMDKIMNKLRIAQIKAQEMRKRMSANEAPRTSSLKSLHRYPKISLITSCFCSKHR